MSRPDLPLDHVTPYDRFALSDADFEQLLVGGEQQRELIAYFGATEYHDLARLARQAAATPIRDEALRVIIVPGIMGSQLGLRRTAPDPNDVLWVDPIDIGLGRLTTLRMPGTARIVSLGVGIDSYLTVQLHLRAAGFAVSVY